MALGLGHYSSKVKFKLFFISITTLLITLQIISGNVIFVLQVLLESEPLLSILVTSGAIYFSNLLISKLFGGFLQRRENAREQEKYDNYELGKKIRERDAMLQVELEYNFRLAKMQLENDAAKMQMIKDLENESRNNKKADLEMINQMLNKLRGE